MSKGKEQILYTAVRDAVVKSIQQMGIENFEKCSFFISNHNKLADTN